MLGIWKCFPALNRLKSTNSCFICISRRAVEVVESDERKKSSDQKDEAKVSRVSLPQVARVLSEVYGDRMASQSGGPDGESFPLQQKLLVCCLLLLTRSGKSKEVVLGKLHEVYSRLCSQRQVSAVGQSECLSLCGLLESRGVFALKKAKEARLTKHCLLHVFPLSLSRPWREDQRLFSVVWTPPSTCPLEQWNGIEDTPFTFMFIEVGATTLIPRCFSTETEPL